MAAAPVSSLSGPGPPPCTTLSSTVAAAAAALQSSRAAAAAAALVGGRGEAWPPVVLPSVGTPVKRQPPEGELLQWAPHIHHHLDHHLSHTFPGRTRPKKEDWLKKKDRKQRRPGSRRKKTSKKERVSSCPGPLSFTFK